MPSQHRTQKLAETVTAAVLQSVAQDEMDALSAGGRADVVQRVESLFAEFGEASSAERAVAALYLMGSDSARKELKAATVKDVAQAKPVSTITEASTGKHNGRTGPESKAGVENNPAKLDAPPSRPMGYPPLSPTNGVATQPDPRSRKDPTEALGAHPPPSSQAASHSNGNKRNHHPDQDSPQSAAQLNPRRPKAKKPKTQRLSANEEVSIANQVSELVQPLSKPKVGSWKCKKCSSWNSKYVKFCKGYMNDDPDDDRRCSGRKETAMQCVQEDDGTAEKEVEHYAHEWLCRWCGHWNRMGAKECAAKGEELAFGECGAWWQDSMDYMQEEDDEHPYPPYPHNAWPGYY